MNAPEAYPQGYVEDAFEARTKLKACLNSLARFRRGRRPAPYSNKDSRANFLAYSEFRW